MFVSACQKLTTSKSSRPTTPNHYTPRGQQQPSYNPAGGPYAMASPGNATGSTTTGNGYGPGSGIISGAPPSPGFQHSPHHASIPSSYHKVNTYKRSAVTFKVLRLTLRNFTDLLIQTWKSWLHLNIYNLRFALWRVLDFRFLAAIWLPKQYLAWICFYQIHNNFWQNKFWIWNYIRCCTNLVK